MRCKIVRFQKFMWRNMIRSTKSQKTSVLHYSIDIKKAFFFLANFPCRSIPTHQVLKIM